MHRYNLTFFDSVSNNGRRPKQPHRQWHVLSINAQIEDTNDTQNRPCDSNTATPTEGSTSDPSQTIDLWSTHDTDIRLLQHQSTDLQPILNWLEDSILPDTDKEASRVILQSEHFEIVDELLYHLHHPRTKRLNEIKPVIQQLCVPQALREELLIEC